MHKLLLSFTALGAMALGGLAPAWAASATPIAVFGVPAQVQTVQYYGGYRGYGGGYGYHRWHHWHHPHYWHHYRGY